MDGTSVVKSVREKVAKLIADNRRLRRDYKAEIARGQKLRSRNDELTARIAQLENRVAVLEMTRAAGGGTAGEDIKIARARVNRLMREVDKCIALLNR